MAVLALDLASVTGWAIHMKGMEDPVYGSLTLPRSKDEDYGPTMEGLRVFLRDKHQLWTFTHVVFEAQHVAFGKGKGMDMKAVNKLLVLGGMVERWCHRMGIPCYKAPIATWRKHFLGKGKFPNRDAAKAKCLAVVNSLGWHTVEEDAAEACGILDYFLSEMPDYERPWRDRMLAGGAVR